MPIAYTLTACAAVHPQHTVRMNNHLLGEDRHMDFYSSPDLAAALQSTVHLAEEQAEALSALLPNVRCCTAAAEHGRAGCTVRIDGEIYWTKKQWK